MRGRVLAVVVAAVCLAGSLVGAPAAVAGDDSHTPVASDGAPARAARAAPPSDHAGDGRQQADRDDPTADGPVAAENGRQSIITHDGTGDDRRRVGATANFPNSAIALVTFQQFGWSSWCTGFLIGPSTVATAGHCVHTGGRGGRWSTNVRVYPGSHSPRTQPFGSCRATRLWSVNGWTRQARDDRDYGAIELDCSVGEHAGWLGVFEPPRLRNGQPTRVQGYPSDRQLGSQWLGRGKVRGLHEGRVFYDNDTVGGMSGSPVFIWWGRGGGCHGYCAFAVHGYGLYGRGLTARWNHGTRVTETVAANLAAWAA